MTIRPQEKNGLSQDFNQASATKTTSKTKSTAPFSIRFTPEERSRLDQLAGSKPLARYIRERLLGEHVEKRQSYRKPKVDEQQIALVLAELGKSRLSSNLNQLAKHANCGTLEVSDDTEKQLHDAYQAILAMRDALIMALGLKPEEFR